MRLALAGGGTGGHIVPGLHLLAHRADGEVADLLWFQSGRAVEERAMASLEGRFGREAFERIALKVEPHGGGAPSLVHLSILAPSATVRARAAMQRRGCEVLLGLGGITCLPAVVAARSLGIPVALLEINAAVGKATRWLAPLCDRVFHAWTETLPPVDGQRGETRRHRWTGAPLAPAFLRGAPDRSQRLAARAAEGFSPDRPLVVVLGGSQGAAALNRFLSEHAGILLERGVQVLHQVGPGRLAEAAGGREGYRAVEYVTDVHRALCAATLVLCRGGASTLAEVGALRRPAWVVPYPHHPDRHQEKNARQLGHGVRLVREEELGADLARELARAAGPAGEDERERMVAGLRGLVPLDGAERIWSELQALARERSSIPSRGA